MEDSPGSHRIAALVTAKVACCVALLAALTGGFAGLGAWFRDSGPVWLGAAAVLGIGGLVLWRRRGAAKAADGERPASPSSVERAR